MRLKPTKYKLEVMCEEGGTEPPIIKDSGLEFHPNFQFNTSFRYPNSVYKYKLRLSESRCGHCGIKLDKLFPRAIQTFSGVVFFKCNHCNAQLFSVGATQFWVIPYRICRLCRFINYVKATIKNWWDNKDTDGGNNAVV